jgi:hypothetical protein
MHRNVIERSNCLAFGCSHTWGVGVEASETWAYLLGAKNFGVPGVSSDYIVRTAPDIIAANTPAKIYLLWPDWTRFEYQKNKVYQQSLPSHPDRIYFMKTATDKWLKENFELQQQRFRHLCNNNRIKLIEMTLYDLVPYIDHSDRWPLSKLGHHYSPVWHIWVADIFRKKENEQT